MPTPNDIEAITNELENFTKVYSKKMQATEKEIYQKLVNRLKSLTTDSQGNIKQTVSNYRIITQSKMDMRKILSGKDYINNVSSIGSEINTITNMQSAYFASVFPKFAAPVLINELKSQAIISTVESLTESGINETLVKKASKIIADNIKSGRNFTDMTKELEDYIKGNDKVEGRLTSYSKQIINDTMSQYAGNYTKLVTDDLGLEWFEFVGGLMRDSRPMCIKLHKKHWIHQSEFTGITNGIVDGEDVSTQGFIDGTDASNFQIYRCGYNCQHLVVPVSELAVPKELRNEHE
jgi:hypothetical protein